MSVNKGTSKTKSTVDTAHVRVHRPAVRRIAKLTKRLTSERRGRWAQPDVVDEALDALDRELAAIAGQEGKPHV